MAKDSSAKGLPKRTKKPSMKAKTARYFARVEAKKARRVRKNALKSHSPEESDKIVAAWKLKRIHKALGIAAG